MNIVEDGSTTWKRWDRGIALWNVKNVMAINIVTHHHIGYVLSRRVNRPSWIEEAHEVP